MINEDCLPKDIAKFNEMPTRKRGFKCWGGFGESVPLDKEAT